MVDSRVDEINLAIHVMHFGKLFMHPLSFLWYYIVCEFSKP